MNEININRTSDQINSDHLSGSYNKITNSANMKKMEEGYLDKCPISSSNKDPISKAKMEEYVQNGQEIALQIASGDINKRKYNLEDIRNLMWFLTCACANEDKLFTNGSIRIDDPENKIYDFLMKASSGSAYNRISSHMKENISDENPQWGIELSDKQMPAGKHAILFAKQPDGTLFLKMEKAGLPPFWKKGFRSLKNFTQFSKHCMEFIHTRFYKKGSSTLATRKEHVPKEIKKQYTDVMNLLFPKEKKSFFQKIQTKSAQEERKADGPMTKSEFKEGIELGLSKMKEKIEQFEPDREEITNFKQHLDTVIKDQRPDGYQGDVKGNEVLLPALEKILT